MPYSYLDIPFATVATSTTAQPAVYSQNFPQAVLSEIKGRKMSIVRFQLPINAMPFFSYVNNSWSITISFNGTDYKQTISIPNLDINTLTGVIYLSQMLTGINSAIALAFTALQTANPTLVQFQNAPFVYFDSKTQLFSITFDAGGWINSPSFNSTTTAQLYFCTPLAELFGNMEQDFVATNSTSGKDSLIIVEQRPNNVTNNPPYFLTTLSSALTAGTSASSISVVEIPFAVQQNTSLIVGAPFNTGTTISNIANVVTVDAKASSFATSISVTSFVPLSSYAVGTGVYIYNPSTITMSDESSSAIDWLSLSTLQITTSLLPVRPNMYGAGYLAGYNESVLTQSKVLTDFLIPTGDRLTSNSNLTYYPTAEYRRLDMIGSGPLNQVDASVNVIDRFGNSFPLLIAPGFSGSLKILFEWEDDCDEPKTKRRKLS